jgi:hypothetical protein
MKTRISNQPKDKSKHSENMIIQTVLVKIVIAGVVVPVRTVLNSYLDYCVNKNFHNKAFFI